MILASPTATARHLFMTTGVVVGTVLSQGHNYEVGASVTLTVDATRTSVTNAMTSCLLYVTPIGKPGYRHKPPHTCQRHSKPQRTLNLRRRLRHHRLPHPRKHRPHRHPRAPQRPQRPRRAVKATLCLIKPCAIWGTTTTHQIHWSTWKWRI